MAFNTYGSVDITDFVGKTFVKIENRDDAELFFWAEDNKNSFRMCHHQDCCESVYLSEVIGDLDDLVGVPILHADCVTSDGGMDDDGYGSSTWTFYRLSTIRGSVTLRWYGESNGYYSEEISIDAYRSDDEG